MAIPQDILNEYFELLKFETVGADPVKLRDCLCCATWIQKWLSPLGFKTELMQAPGLLGTPPVVFAERKGDEGAPTILFYGHYDVFYASQLIPLWIFPFRYFLRVCPLAFGVSASRGREIQRVMRTFVVIKTPIFIKLPLCIG